MKVLRGALSDALSVVVTGLRLVMQHGPVLLVIFLLGSAVRNGALWAAVAVSASHSTLAGFILPLAPMATLTAIIVMLRVVSSTLAFATFAPDAAAGQPPGRTTPLLALLASTLIPFLTVYAAQGYLKEDVRRFVNAASYDEIFGSAGAFYGQAGNVDRTAFAGGALLVGIVAVALVLRFAIGRFDLPSRHVSWGIFAAYVEVVWLFVLARQFTRYQDSIWDWVRGRVFVDWVDARWSALVDVLGPVGVPVAAVAHGVGNVLSDADAVLLIPVAWLTVAAVALGQDLSAPPRAKRDRAWDRPVQRVPASVRRIGVEATADVRGRFAGLGNGVRLLAVGGLLPMLLFCLVFVIARQAGRFVYEVVRVVAGPTGRDDALAFLPYVTTLSEAVYTLLLVGLLGAAIDRVLRNRQQLAAHAAVQPAVQSD